MKERLGFVGIIIEDRKNSAEKINKILSAYGDIIIGRMGIPYEYGHCSIINLIVKADSDQIGSLTGKLGSIKGVKVKSALSKEL